MHFIQKTSLFPIVRIRRKFIQICMHLHVYVIHNFRFLRCLHFNFKNKPFTYVIAEDRFDLASDLMHKMFEFYIFGVAGNQVCSIKRRRCRTRAAGFKNRLMSGPLIVICQANTIKDINVRLDN